LSVDKKRVSIVFVPIKLAATGSLQVFFEPP
jgi:hypothetical protein